jgi:glycosyltransferase involved in cell wall biosynthesis
LSELYSGAKALLFPAEDEDFGMVPVEAMGHGTPVIAHRSGGPLESIIEDKTGLFFDQLDVASLVKAIRKFEKMNLDDRQIRQHALKFGKSRFEAEIKEFVKNKIS